MPNQSSWVAAHDSELPNVTGHHTTCGYDTAPSNANAGEHDRVRSDPYVILDDRGARFAT